MKGTLKKLLAPALVAAMLAGVLAVQAGAAYQDADQIVHAQAVGILAELNIMEGVDADHFGPERALTRGEIAKILTLVLNGGEAPEPGTAEGSTFSDTTGHWAAGYIEYCAEKGVIAGRGDGTFGPDIAVTGKEAAKLLAVTMGCDAETEGFTGASWGLRVNVAAQRLGLYEGIDVDPSEPLTRDAAAQMVYNALTGDSVSYEQVMVTNADGEQTSIPKQVSGAPLLELRFGMRLEDGILVPVPAETP